jgi:amino acid adenylation domain-containing protein
MLFGNPTVASLAAALTQLAPDGAVPGVASGSGSAHEAIAVVPRTGRLPLSPVQQRLWFLDQLEPDSAFYAVAGYWRIRGPLDVSRLSEALTRVVSRHEALRTNFLPQDGEPFAVVRAPAPVRVPVADAEGADPAARWDDAMRLLADQETRPFNLAADLLVRPLVVRLGPGDHLMSLAFHHIVVDGWSVSLVLRELAACYLDRSGARLPSLDIQYVDYAAWQRSWLADSDGARQALARWQEALAGAPATTELPTTRPRLAAAAHRGGSVQLTLPAPVTARLAELARSQNATLFMAALAVFDVLLYRYTSRKDLVVGVPAAGRGRPELEPLVGFFVNTLPIRIAWDGELTFRELLALVRDAAVRAFEDDAVPFDRLVEQLDLPRDLSRNPLFQIIVQAVAGGESGEDVDWGGQLQVSELLLPVPHSRFDLEVFLRENPDGTLTCWFNYSAELFDERDISRLLDHYRSLIKAVTADPGQAISALPILDADERARMATQGRGPAVPPPDTTIIDLFEQRAAACPAATALACGDRDVTYQQLDTEANQLAHRLAELGAGPETVVGVCLPRGSEAVVAALAIWKSGAGYLGIDPALPAERRAYIIGDARATAVITTAGLAASLGSADPGAVGLRDVPVVLADAGRHYPGSPPPRQVTASNLAYLIYTSGSTGRPKGIQVEHRVLAGLARWQLPVTPGRRVLHAAPYGFCVSLQELVAALLAGHTLVIDPDTDTRLVDELPVIMRRHAVDTAFLTPALFGALLGQPGFAQLCAERPLKVFTAGDRLVLPTDWARPGLTLENHYGQSESHVVTRYLASPDSSGVVAIGQPVPGCEVYVLDGDGALVPSGVAGELYLGGDQVARGYHGRPGPTAERFVPDPFGTRPGQRLYRTGDLARWGADGNLEFLGRVDEQVQIRGNRVEPGEIEAVLQDHPAVDSAIVVPMPDASGELRLVAYLTGTPTADSALRDHLRAVVPGYMIPAGFSWLDRLPLNANGKVIRSELPSPAPAQASADRPRSAAEWRMAAVWQDVLGVNEVGAHDDFFQSGGHSLLATRLVSRIRSVFGRDLPIRAVFEAPTVAGLVRRLGTAADAPPRLRPADRPGIVPLSWGQRRMWFLNRLNRADAAYRIPCALRLSGNVDVAALQQAVRDVVGRHEVLRTVFPEESGEPRQMVRPTPDAAELLPVVPVDSLPEALRQVTIRGFDLRTDLPVRGSLLEVSADDHVLVLVIHHIAGDGWSLAPLARDLAAAYSARCIGQAPDWAPLPVQYADFALWQRAILGERSDPDSPVGRQLEYWRTTLAGVPQELELPYDRPRPAISSGRGGEVPVQLPGELCQRLARLARDHGASLFMALHAAFAALLSRLGAGSDIPIGTPVAGRADEALDDLVGFFVNTLVLRADIGGDPTFAELLARVRDLDLAAYAHQDVPFEHLVEDLRPARSMARHPLFQVMFAFDNNDEAKLELPGLSVREQPLIGDTAKFDLMLVLRDSPGPSGAAAGIGGWLRYSSDLFDHETIVAVAERLAGLLAAVVAHPEQPVSWLDVPGLPGLRLGAGPALAPATPRVPSSQPLPPPREPTAEARGTRSPREEVLCAVFAEVLGMEEVGVDDDFFALGGHSLMLVRLVSRIREVLGTSVDIGQVFATPTVAALSALHPEADQDGLGPVLTLRGGAAVPPLFCVHPAFGLSWCYAGLLSRLQPGQPVYGLQSRGVLALDALPETMDELVDDYVRHIRDIQPHGPYHLLGWSFGAVAAHAVAARLTEAGEKVALLALLDGYPASHGDGIGTPRDEPPAAIGDLAAVLQQHYPVLPALAPGQVGRLAAIAVRHMRIAEDFQCPLFEGDGVLFVAGRRQREDPRAGEAWAPHITGDIEVHYIDCAHHEMTGPAALDAMAPVLGARLTRPQPFPTGERK